MIQWRLHNNDSWWCTLFFSLFYCSTIIFLSFYTLYINSESEVNYLYILEELPNPLLSCFVTVLTLSGYSWEMWMTFFFFFKEGSICISSISCYEQTYIVHDSELSDTSAGHLWFIVTYPVSLPWIWASFFPLHASFELVIISKLVVGHTVLVKISPRACLNQ